MQVTQGQRRLVAVFFSDIVRYSAISSADEDLALRLLEEHRVLSRPIIKKHNGTEVKTIGDAFLLTFPSALSAVECGIEILKLHQERNTRCPDQEAIQLRIGIHIADVIFSGDDVYGDGVNIASRLQGMARPGTLCLSGSVFYQVGQHLEQKTFPIGAVALKNIKNKIALYIVAVTPSRQDLKELRALSHAESKKIPRLKVWLTASLAALLLGLAGVSMWKLKSIRQNTALKSSRLAVLTFEGIGLKPEDQYLLEGITEEVNSSLVQLGKYRVLARNSVREWEKQPISEIVRALGISALVKGNLRKVNSKIYVTLQLVDGKSEETRWSKAFEGDSDKLFQFQKVLVTDLDQSLSPVDEQAGLAGAVQPRAEATPKSEAYEHYLRGRHFMAQRTPQSLRRAQAELEQAVALDTKFSAAFAALTNVYSLQYYYGGLAPIEAGRKIFEVGEKALALDPLNSDAQLSIAEAYAYIHHDWKKANELFQKALVNNPKNMIAHQWYAEFLASRGNFPEALNQIAQASELDPGSLNLRCASANVHYQAGDYARSMSEAMSVLAIEPNMMLAHYWYGRSAFEAGYVQESIKSLSRAVALSENSSATLAALGYALARAEQPKRAREILKELQQKKGREYYSSYDLATLYSGLNDVPGMINALKNAYAERSSYLALIKNDPAFKRHLRNPDYRAFLQTMPF
ncbi:MAG: hypothetical protein A2070_00265 [Bdellovibrionales bacterium GWC1_52_8]|nr:MAG: hypothetical protein A2Z97_08095 [Bdellovibrionales bacterium GWB1_52_6]OFZ03809.1 MAG: hypothetical protein A2X97_15535 [Bdellovibrionales bacterium GWA1_52_35]OFZ36864.1 MAG: hypothetical protein A2070_00265 [Bdellovibrionales bacterium GWC1_52_8]HCM40910.1 hypothetical protein [Bdellovibrionales bacterium]